MKLRKNIIVMITSLLVIIWLSGCAHQQLDSQIKSKLNTVVLDVYMMPVITPMLHQPGPSGQGGFIGAMVETAIQNSQKSAYQRETQLLDDFVKESRIWKYIDNRVFKGISENVSFAIVEPQQKVNLIDEDFNYVKSKSGEKVDAYLRLDLTIALTRDYSLLLMSAKPMLYEVVDGKIYDLLYESHYQYQSLPIYSENILLASKKFIPALKKWHATSEAEFPQKLQDNLFQDRIKAWVDNNGENIRPVVEEALNEFLAMINIELGVSDNVSLESFREIEVDLFNRISPGISTGSKIKGQVLSQNKDRVIVRTKNGELISVSTNMSEQVIAQGGLVENK